MTTSTTTSFELLREQDLPELNAKVRFYRHIRTGAEVLSLINDDENKVFGITFRTPPTDSTGVAHILEHSVLCGSRKYPVKEPFVELIKGSLKTFLNAFTYPDKTCYPVASQNTQDFYNLIDVYLDAVFYPRITPHIFAQEGWHYELERLEDPLVYKGVVFNEMKGSYSSPDRLMGELAQQSLFPDTTYGVSSGGHPQYIPDLTYEQFKRFHQTLYHPSNARIYFYGDDDPDKRLQIIDEFLKDFDRLEIDSDIHLQSRFDAPHRVVETYPVDADSPGGNKARMTVNWMLTENTDPQTILALSILEHILLGTPASPLRKALLDSGLGEDITGAGFADWLRQGYFSVGLKGITMEDADKVETLILQTLTHLAQNGIDANDIEAALNTVEFRLHENNTGSFPRGLAAMIVALNTWLYDGDPLALLAFEAPLTAIKERLDGGQRYFEELIQSFLLNNTHRTTTILQPDPQQSERDVAQERARLDTTRAAMTEDELHALIEETKLLKEMQVTPDPPESLATIPGLTLADLDRQNRTIPLDVLNQQGTPVLYHDLHTNGITYLDIGMNLHTLPHELLPYAALFGRLLLEMGTQREDYVQLSQRIGRKTGGISSSRISSSAQGVPGGVVWLFLRGKAVQQQNTELLAILQDILLTPRLDNQERFRQIVLEAKARKEASIIPGGHGIVDTRLRSHFNMSDWVDEQMGGITQLFFLRQLVQEIEQDWPGVLAKLEQIRQTLVNRNAMLCNITLDETNWSNLAPTLDAFLAAMPIAPAEIIHWTPTYGAGFEGLTIPSQVNYVGKGADLYRSGYTFHGSSIVITKYLRATWLWERVRVQGGAYGSFCNFDRHSGVLSYLSYRDPNLLNTLNVYDETSQFLRKVDLNDKEVTRSIIGAISDIDSYQLPDAKGYTSMVRYLINDTDETRQRMRDEILATTAQDFRAFADVLDYVKEQGIITVMGSTDAIDLVNTQRGGMLNKLKVL